ncbi:MAG: DUF72 domain-containing protein [Polyangiaceae bacterium]
MPIRLAWRVEPAQVEPSRCGSPWGSPSSAPISRATQPSSTWSSFSPAPGAVPRHATLRAWRKAVNPSFTFSVVLPRIVGELKSSKALDAALNEALGVATAVEARCIVLSTPPEVRPTSVTVERLKSVFDRLPRLGVVLCWEPHGLWERSEIVSVAKQLSIVPVLDVARVDPAPGPLVYTRLRSLGRAGGLSGQAIEQVASRLASRREAWVVLDHRASATRVRSALASLLDHRAPAAPPVTVRTAPGRLRADDEEQ